jgi:hypothetical protein
VRKVGLGENQGHILQTRGTIIGVGRFFGGANEFATANLPSRYRSTLPFHELETILQST